MKPDRARIEEWFQGLNSTTQQRINQTVDILAETKEKGGKIAVVTGSGPNVHEGVTTLLAELMRVGVVDGITTSSAVVAHEMGGVLDRVKRVNGIALGADKALLPRGDVFEFTFMDDEQRAIVEQDLELDQALLDAGEKIEGNVIIKAAGNMGYPMGLWIEQMSDRICAEAQEKGLAFEAVAGWYADERTMLGRGARLGLPVLVSIPQLVGGGNVGLAVGDSISITQRARLVADLLASADVIIESAVALTQEIHDGPYEMYTGHGIWAAWQGIPTYTLEKKRLIRIDLDSALDRAWKFERESKTVQQAIDKGLPKTKLMEIPFRMEMSGFARLEGSLPLIGDIGVIWPILASRLEQRLGLDLEFISAPQQTPEGQAMRNWIVEQIRPITSVAAPAQSRQAARAR
ncbi:MAG TPA: hypothetical protein PLQ35_11880 [bacterium]|nr:hypothetical protein [bacterium]HQL62984.1 hypothetical protein [bacterium]